MKFKKWLSLALVGAVSLSLLAGCQNNTPTGGSGAAVASPALCSVALTAPAVIKQINLLEEGLGVKLFTRTHRGLLLTEAGKSMYGDTKRMIQDCNEAVARAQNAMQDIYARH